MSDQDLDTKNQRVRVIRNVEHMNIIARELALRYMEEEGLNKTQLAGRTNLSKSRICEWLRGKDIGHFGIYNLLLAIGHDMAIVTNPKGHKPTGETYIPRMLM